MLRFFSKLLRKAAVSNIYLYDIVRHFAADISLMLPHDEAFHGLAKFGDGSRCMLDIGANDGISARSYRKLVPKRPILSIEANPFHKDRLERLKTKIANFDYKLIAAGSEPGQLILFTPVYKGVAMTNYASMSPEIARANLERHMRIRNLGTKAVFRESCSQVTTIDDLGLDPQLVKIDVEGYEAQVVAGMSETIKISRPVLMIEHNPASFPELKRFFGALDYRIASYDRRSDVFVDFDERDPDLNVFFIPIKT